MRLSMALLGLMSTFALFASNPGTRKVQNGPSVTIQGTVLDTDMNPVAGVIIRISGDTTAEVLTDSFGAFSIMVDTGWSGKLTPFKNYTLFMPGSISFSDLSTNTTADFSALDWCGSVEVVSFDDVLMSLSIWNTGVVVLDGFHFDQNDDGISDVIDLLTLWCRYENQDPSFLAGSAVDVLEDSGAWSQIWASNIDDGEGGQQSYWFDIQQTVKRKGSLFSINPALANDGTLTFSPTPDAFGNAIFNVTLHDNWGGISPASELNIHVLPVNDPPSFTDGGDVTFFGTTDPQTIAGWATDIQAGPANESSQMLSFNILMNSQPSLFDTAPAVDPISGDLTFTPAIGANGTATIGLNLSDDGGTANGGSDTSSNAVFDISIALLNLEPTFSAGGNQSILEDSGPQTVAGWATNMNDGNGGVQTMNFIVSNDNNALFTVQPDVDEVSGDLTYTPVADAFGTANVMVTLMDDGGTVGGGDDTSPTAMMTITLAPINDPPSFTSGGNVNYMGSATPQTLAGWATNIQKGPANEASQVLSFNLLMNSQPSLFDVAPAVDPLSGDLTYTPANGANGTATISLNLMDDGGTANGGNDTSSTAMFDISIAALNMEPTFTEGGNESIPEDSAAQTVSAWATNIDDGNGGIQTLSFIVSNDNNALFTVQPDVDEGSGDLTYTPAADAFGTANVMVTLMDDGGTAGGGDDTSPTAMMTIALSPINDEPSFTLGMNVSVSEDSGAQSLTGWATNISPGNAFESGQVLTFSISNDNTGLFSVQPDVDELSGTLSFTPAANMSGSATVTLSLSDDGGTANGGDDQSPDQMFTITVTPVDDPPIATNDAFSVISNLLLEVGVMPTGFPAVQVSGSLLDNDTDIDSGSITVQSTGTFATTLSGSVTLNADGSFVYTPPAGVSPASDTFSYTITDGTTPDSGTVTLTISQTPIWFVNNTAPSGGTGLANAPFNSLSDLSAPIIEAGDIIYIYEGTTTTPGNALNGAITLLNNMSVIGQEVALNLVDPNDMVQKTFVPATNAPVMTNSTGSSVINLAMDNSVMGFDLLLQANGNGISGLNAGGSTQIAKLAITTDTMGAAISLDNQSGTLNLTDISLSGSGSAVGFSFQNATSTIVNVDGLTCTGISGISLVTNNGVDFNFLNTTTLTNVPTGLNANANPNSTIDFGTLILTNLSSTGISLQGAHASMDPDVTINTLNVSGGTVGEVLSVTNFDGFITILAGSISHSGGRIYNMSNVDGASLEASVNSTNANALGVSSFNNCSGTFNFGNVIYNNGSGPGISITNSPMASFTFDAGLNAQASGAFALLTDTVGELNITTGSIMAAGALSLKNTVIGNQGVTWTSISSNSSSSSGIVLDGVSATGMGSFNVTGTATVNMATTYGVLVQNSSCPVTINTIDIDAASADGFRLVNNTGAVTVTSGDISGAAANGVFINQGNAAVNLGCTVQNNGTYAAQVTNRTGGTINFNGAITQSSGNGIQVSNNSSGAPIINFNALATLNTGTNAAITLTTNTGASLLFNNIDLDTTTGTALSVSATGSLQINQGTVNTTNGVGINLSGSALAVNLTSATIANSAGGGVTLSNNTGTTHFNALTITNTGGTGLSATNAGSLSVAGSANTIASTTGIAVSISNTTIAGDGTSGGINLRSVSSSGAVNGIYLNTTGTGRFVVTGTGSAGSGGTLQTITNNGVELRSCNNISLSYMNLTNANTTDNCGTEAYDETGSENCRGAIYMNTVGHITFNNLAINGTTEQGINGVDVTHFQMNNSSITNAGNSTSESAIVIRDLLGTSADGNTNVISGCTITNSAQIGVFIRNLKRTNDHAGAPDRLEITNTTVTQSGDNTAADNITISLRDDPMGNGSNMQVIVSGCTLTGTNGEITDAIQFDSGINAKGDFEITDTTTNNCNTAINISAANSSTTTFNVHDNTNINTDGGQGVNIACNGTAIMTGWVTGNIIDSFNTNNPGFGIDAVVDASGTLTIEIVNNNVTDFSIPVRAGARNSGSGIANISITDNTMSSGGGFAFGVLWVFSGNSGGQSNSVCANIAGNNFNDPFGTQEYYIEQYAGSTLSLQGYMGSATSQSAIQTFLEGNNIAGDALVETCCGTSTNVTNATCTTP